MRRMKEDNSTFYVVLFFLTVAVFLLIVFGRQADNRCLVVEPLALQSVVAESEPICHDDIPFAATPLLFVRQGDQLLEQLIAICGEEETEWWFIDVVNVNNLSERELGEEGFVKKRLLILPLKLVEDNIKSDQRLQAIAIVRDGDCYWSIWSQVRDQKTFADWPTSVTYNDSLSNIKGQFQPGDMVYLPSR